MIPQGLITQIGMIILAIGIAITYVKPMFVQVSAAQDKIGTYREEQTKVSNVNTKLNSLKAQASEISSDARTRLNTYLPSEVDIVAVQRDLLFIAEEAGIELTGLTAEEKKTEVKPAANASTPASDPEAEGEVVPTPVPVDAVLYSYTFELGFAEDYQTIKNFFALLQQNNYPLFVKELSITSPIQTEETVGGVGADLLPVTVTLETYSMSVGEAAN